MLEAVHALVNLLVQLELIESAPHRSVFEDKAELPLRLLSKQYKFDEEEAIKKVAEHLSLEALDLTNDEVKDKIDKTLLKPPLDSELCWKHKIIPLWEEGEFLAVASANPFDQEGIKTLGFTLNAKPKLYLAEEREIVSLLRENVPASRIEFDSIEGIEDDEDDSIEILGQNQIETNPSGRQVEAKPIIRLCNKIIADAHISGASDIHLEPMDGALEIRFRIDGVMHTIMQIPERLKPAVTSRIKLLSGMDIADHRKPQDGRFGVKIDGDAIDVRVSCIPTTFGENLVLRLLNNDCTDLTLQALGLTSYQEKSIRGILESRGKMMLVTGPTGSGKSTTLYTCLNQVRDGSQTIATVEDPIEYRVPGVQQVQVHEAAGITFASALRSLLRQDPDIIMIGEIRDEETAKIALQAAQTGHLVLSTLHTNDAPSAIIRLDDLGAPSYLIAASVAGIVAQRLVRKVCETCKSTPEKKYLMEHAERMAQHSLTADDITIGVGCETCHYTGYKGRTAIYSYLHIDEEISQMIHDKASPPDIVKRAKEDGYETLEERGIAIVREGITTIDEMEPYLLTINSSAKKKGPEATKRKVIQLEEHQEIVFKTKEEKTIKRDKILLIEDDPDVRSILSMLLQKEMYEVIEAEDGLEALEKVYKNRPTLIISDLMMPRMDGKEFLVKMKSNAKTKDIPILMLTAANSEENEVDLINLGANDFVGKAASSSVFLSRVRRALAEHS